MQRRKAFLSAPKQQQICSFVPFSSISNNPMAVQWNYRISWLDVDYISRWIWLTRCRSHFIQFNQNIYIHLYSTHARAKNKIQKFVYKEMRVRAHIEMHIFTANEATNFNNWLIGNEIFGVSHGKRSAQSSKCIQYILPMTMITIHS